MMEEVDQAIGDLVEADDALRRANSKYTGTSMVITGPWSLITEPWSVMWLNDKEESCILNLLSPPVSGEKLVMFLGTFDGKSVINLIAFNEEYCSVRPKRKTKEETTSESIVH